MPEMRSAATAAPLLICVLALVGQFNSAATAGVQLDPLDTVTSDLNTDVTGVTDSVTGATAASPPLADHPPAHGEAGTSPGRPGRPSPCRPHRAPRTGCPCWPRSPAFSCSCPGRRGS